MKDGTSLSHASGNNSSALGLNLSVYLDINLNNVVYYADKRSRSSTKFNKYDLSENFDVRIRELHR